MTTEANYPTIRQRVVVLFFNTAIAWIVFVVASGRFLPTGNLADVWLISAFALFFFTLLSSPWFVPPRDALVNAATSAIILVTTDLSALPGLRTELDILRWSAIAFCAVVIVGALTALFLHKSPRFARAGRFAFRVTSVGGRGEVLYAAPAMISIIGGYQSAPIPEAWLLLVWLILTQVRLVERVAEAIRLFRAELSGTRDVSPIGRLDRIDHPDIVRVRLTSPTAWRSNTLHVAGTPDGKERYVLALFSQIQGADVVGTGLCVAAAESLLGLQIGEVRASHDEVRTAAFLEQLSGSAGSKLIGFVVERSTIGTLRFEMATTSGLCEGDVVFVRIAGQNIFYQVVDAETVEESFDQNPRGTQLVDATQLGKYSAESGFLKFEWLPSMNAPVFGAGGEFPATVLGQRDIAVGKVPSTNISVTANIDQIVEFHTAVLGVTGTGKTELVLDIVRQALAKGINVFCVDFTAEYRERLADLNPLQIGPTALEGQNLEAKLFAVETGTYGAPNEKRELKQAVDALRMSTTGAVAAFLRGQNPLAIFELAEIANTKASLRITEIYLSAIMDWARQNRRAKQIMIVLEEAHTIIPETAGSGFDYDTQWVVSRIGQLALQGRKYGVGLMVVTQRTALVSKTVLSQCNTFFVHSLIDQTSLTFLESVVGRQHARIIPNLRHLEFLAVGKALRADRPIVLRRDFDPAKKQASERLGRPLANVTTPEPLGAEVE